MKIKMIALDLDGTLFRDDKTVSERNEAALRKCSDAGIKIVYASARGKNAIKLLPPALFNGCVCMNGAAAYADGVLIYDKAIPVVNLKKLLINAINSEIDIALEHNDRIYSSFPFPDDWDPIYLNNYEVTDFQNLDFDVNKIWAMPKSEEDIDILKEHLPEELYIVTTRDDFFTMILHEDASKSKALAVLAGYWGISSDEIAAFGDDVNDIDMLRCCGTSVAMGNAVDEVKAVANYFCDTNENDGIAKWLEENILADV